MKIATRSSDDVRYRCALWLLALIVIPAALSCSSEPSLTACEGAAALNDTGPTSPFTDDTADLGLDHAQWAEPEWWPRPSNRAEESEREALLPAAMTGGVSVVDYDQDGWEDVFVGRVNLPDMLFRNICGAEFVDVASQVGIDNSGATSTALFFDADNDGDMDIFAAGILGTPHRLYLHENGVYEDYGLDSGILQGMVGPDFEPSPIMGVAGSDYDRDGDIDLLLAGWQRPFHPLQAGSSSLYENDGTGKFQDVTAEVGLDLSSVAAFTSIFDDVSGDGLIDLAVAGDWGTSRLYLGTVSGEFTDATSVSGVGLDEHGMGASLADLDADGDLDWFVSSIFSSENCDAVDFGCAGNRLYLNSGTGTFEEVAAEWGVADGSWGWGTSADDLDNDGLVDLLMANGMSTGSPDSSGSSLFSKFENDAVRVWLGQDGGHRLDSAEALGLDDRGSGKSVVTVDYDRDGDLDVLIGNTGSGPRLYTNRLSTEAGWIQIEPRRLDGIPDWGSRVEILSSPPAAEQRRDIRLGDTYQGQRSSVAHFGLGDTQQVAVDVVVVWSDGSRTSFDGLEVRQRHVLLAGER